MKLGYFLAFSVQSEYNFNISRNLRYLSCVVPSHDGFDRRSPSSEDNGVGKEVMNKRQLSHPGDDRRKNPIEKKTKEE
jgi:hypothetical protein